MSLLFLGPVTAGARSSFRLPVERAITMNPHRTRSSGDAAQGVLLSYRLSYPRFYMGRGPSQTRRALRVSRDRHPFSTTLYPIPPFPPFQSGSLLTLPKTEPHTIATDGSTMLGRPQTRTERSWIPTVLYAFPTTSGISSFHTHGRRYGVDSKANVPSRAHARP
jgi:hypothetical protein